MELRRKTKIIATIGPASIDFVVFKSLIEEGVDIIRINTSYGDYAQYDQIINNLKTINDMKVQVLYDIKKEENLDYFIDNNLDILAISFADNSDQIENYRNKTNGKFIVAKIESVKGVENIDQLVNSADGIMIARGDLSEAETVEKIPQLEKYLTKKVKQKRMFLIVATEMMLSMVGKSTPEIAEVSDVANAVFEGASAVMLSEETAIGKYPVETVISMRKTIEEAEKWILKNNSD